MVFQFQKIFVTILLAGIICKSSAQYIDHADSAPYICISKDNLHARPVRFIEDNHGHMMITVIGKNGLIAIVRDTITDPLVKGFIADATLGADGKIWYVGHGKISSVDFSKNTNNQNLVPLFYKDQVTGNIANSNDPLFYRDRLGNIWLSEAPFRVGADMKSLPNPQSEVIADKFPLPQATDPFGNKWGLIATGDKADKVIGVISAGGAERWTVLNKNNGFPVGQWHSVVADIEGIIWVGGKAGLVYSEWRNTMRNLALVWQMSRLYNIWRVYNKEVEISWIITQPWLLRRRLLLKKQSS